MTTPRDPAEIAAREMYDAGMFYRHTIGEDECQIMDAAKIIHKAYAEQTAEVKRLRDTIEHLNKVCAYWEDEVERLRKMLELTAQSRIGENDDFNGTRCTET